LIDALTTLSTQASFGACFIAGYNGAMKYIIGNWKMFPKGEVQAKAIFTLNKKAAHGMKRTRVVVCPPYVFIPTLRGAQGKLASITVGAQNAFFEDEGARTGEVSPAMLASLGVTHVILGHSERRALGETNDLVAKKAVQAMKQTLTVVMCVGEDVRDEAGEYFGLVRTQLRESLRGVPANASKRLIVAYEPIWAIGAKATRPATPEDFHEMSILIRKVLVDHFGKIAGFKVPILYGGSVDDRNAEGFMRKGGADGLLIGRVSLDPEKFGAIIQLAESIK
jgi:triosephosphate isomerase (TIM)